MHPLTTNLGYGLAKVGHNLPQTALTRTAQHFALVPSPATIFFVPFSLGGPFVEFWWCFEAPKPKCARIEGRKKAHPSGWPTLPGPNTTHLHQANSSFNFPETELQILEAKLKFFQISPLWERSLKFSFCLKTKFVIVSSRPHPFRGQKWEMGRPEGGGGSILGRGRPWPNRLWPNRLWPAL